MLLGGAVARAGQQGRLARLWVKGPPLLTRAWASAGHCRRAAAALGQGLPEGAPGVEAAGEGVLLVTLAHQAQAAGVLVLFGAHVLDVHLVAGHA